MKLTPEHIKKLARVSKEAEFLGYLGGKLAGLSGIVRYDIPDDLREEIKDGWRMIEERIAFLHGDF